ncbi:MAG: hypothetical protein AAF236_11100 [Verrucomicrobiota bacterium]
MATPASAQIRCPQCRVDLPLESADVSRLVDRCPTCQHEVRAAIFPRLSRGKKVAQTDRAAGDGEAVCSFFPELKAEKVCDECGCFLSEKAVVRWLDRDLCLPCLHRLREQKTDLGFIAKRSVWENRALAMVTLLAPFTLFTAPVAIFWLLRYRHVEAGLLGARRGRWWLALLLSIAWLVLWGLILFVWFALVLEDYR